MIDGLALLADRAAPAVLVLAIIEIARTLYAWHGIRPTPEQHRKIAEVLSLPMEFDEAGRHRAVELGILACVVVVEVALWYFAPIAPSAVLCLVHAAALGSIVLVGEARVRAYRRLLAADARAMRLLEEAIAAKAEPDNPSR